MNLNTTTCPHCERVVRIDSLVKAAIDPDELATLQEDEPLEWFCPFCMEPTSPAVWTNIDRQVPAETLF